MLASPFLGSALGTRGVYDVSLHVTGPGGTSSCSTSVSLGAGEDRTDVDYGYQPLGSIGDRVWLDNDGMRSMWACTSALGSRSPARIRAADSTTPSRCRSSLSTTGGRR